MSGSIFNLKQKDRNGWFEVEVSQTFFNQYTELRARLKKYNRKPTRFELRQLYAEAPANTITEEVSRMFAEFQNEKTL